MYKCTLVEDELDEDVLESVIFVVTVLGPISMSLMSSLSELSSILMHSVNKWIDSERIKVQPAVCSAKFPMSEKTCLIVMIKVF